jgi:hypothetical protein
MKKYKILAVRADYLPGKRFFGKEEFWHRHTSPKESAVIAFRQRFEREPEWVNARQDCFAIAGDHEGNLVIATNAGKPFPF